MKTRIFHSALIVIILAMAARLLVLDVREKTNYANLAKYIITNERAVQILKICYKVQQSIEGSNCHDLRLIGEPWVGGACETNAEAFEDRDYALTFNRNLSADEYAKLREVILHSSIFDFGSIVHLTGSLGHWRHKLNVSEQPVMSQKDKIFVKVLFKMSMNESSTD